jgi:hypothetical protein
LCLHAPLPVVDPQTGHYFWRYSEVSRNTTVSFLDGLENGAEAVYAGKAALVDFYVSARLYSKAHTERTDNLDAAKRASIKEVERGLPVFEKMGFHADVEGETVFKAIDAPEFSCAPYPEMSQNCPNSAKIVSVSQEDDTWRLVLRNRWDQEVILDSKFKIASTRRLPDPPKQ